MKEILEILQADGRLTPRQIATMLNRDEAEVAATIKDMEEKKIILGYFTLINWDKVKGERVSAIIEVKLSPQREVGFDAIAERIYRFPEVGSVRLMSGSYDLSVMINGRTLQEVAYFVSNKLATIENVISTCTHFVLKTYKYHGTILDDAEEDRRLVVTP
ncbi:DNA-binding transcriptional regulator AsnC [Pelotomaculum schinkii]|uniref:DNA-binding transcriptional regulator AsnC n=1 Tax=Pelotomaculum schinkii TaxID=78350 RepID=A0A4Y7R5D6_9FIRM|nr:MULTISPECIES: Lrp/AsnC family transcriptional regulator [Pelotomaculum]TEB04194.1 DNA-binding transcriptional regulator AsnC [Pelotomaculum schinkii]TEB17780.1 DNA-binding transcriptional regulator AsnC [Pelotomaculum sp. FP]